MSGADALVRVLLCDDAPELRRLLRGVLERDPPLVTVVGEAGDGETALRLAAAARPEVVLLDLDMPGPLPAVMLRALGGATDAPAIVTFSGFDPRTVAGSAAARHVATHLPKTTDLPVVRRTVHEVGMRRRAILSP